jgi:hypothetical protein
MHAQPEAFEQRDCIKPGAREKLVNDASGKEVNIGWTGGGGSHLVSTKIL